MRRPSPLSTAHAIALAAVLAATPPAGAQAEPQAAAPVRLTFDLLFGDEPGGAVPEAPSWAPGGRLLAYLWDDGNGKALWLLDVEGRSRSPLVRESEEEGGLELGDYHFSPDGRHILLESGGDLHLLEVASGSVRRLTSTVEEEQDPKFSPDSSTVAFVRDFDLFVLELASGRERALTTGGSEGELLNGVTDWVYWEEIWGRDSTGYWWSPNGDRIAYYQFDESPVGRYPLVDFTTVPYPTVTEQRYPKAGTANPGVRIGVLPVAGGDTVWLATGDADGYLARVDWQPGGERVAVQRLNREQNRLDLLSCDAASGRCGELLSDRHPTWVNLHDHLRFLADGRFLWSSEKSGWRQLALHAADGRELATLSPAGWAVTSLDAVDEASGRVVFTAYRGGGLGAKDRQVLAGSLEGDLTSRLSPADGWNGAVASSESGWWVLTESHSDRPTAMSVRGPDGALALELPSRPPPFDPAGLPRWEFFTLPGPGGVELPAALMRPAGFDPARRYPAIMYHYGGPGSQVVADRWGSRGRDPWHKMMAQRGYAVLAVDNPGSSFFGKPGEDRLHRRFGAVNLAAQRAAVDYLKGLGWVDAGRIGLWGWSGGGSNTLYSVLNSPGTWRAAVAGAPVTDWRLYDTIWTERYLDHPDDNADGYRDSSAVTYAGQLADPVLVVHGTADDNVHPQNSFAFLHAVIEAGAAVETAIYPRQKHGLRGAASRHFYERMTEFFDHHLQPGPAH